MSPADHSALGLRLRLGADALLSLDEATLLLPVPPELGRPWIEANVRQTMIVGVASVRWADVLRAVEASGAPSDKATSADGSIEVAPSRWLSTEEAAELLGVSRATIDRAIARLPSSRRPAQLPTRGRGARVRYGWLGEEALRAWWNGVTAEKGSTPKAPPKRKTNAPSGGVVDWGEVVRDARSKSRS